MNRNLDLVLDAMVRQAKQSLRDTGYVAPFAAILSLQAKISILIAPKQSDNAPHSMRMLEAGLRARIGQGLSKAIGTCQGTGALAAPTSERALQMFLEHSDGTAYRVTVCCANGKLTDTNPAVVPGTPQFFLNVMTRSA